MADQKMSFEQSLRRLEEIVDLLERGEVPLEQSLKLFEEGAKLMQQSVSMLDKAEQKVAKLAELGGRSLPREGDEHDE